MSHVHDFRASLAKSHAAEDLPFWREVYETAFPGMVGMYNHRADGEHQRAGIDRSVIMSTSKQILIDEKVRWRNEITGVVYRDCALEYLSDEEKGTPGWVCKPLRADYIAYAIAPIGQCCLLPVVQLQLAWERNSPEWLRRAEDFREKEFRIVRAQNNRYVTASCALPWRVLFPAIGDCLRVQFARVDTQERGFD